MNVLVTGGAGYIGSHTVLALLRAGHGVEVVDNLCNSSAEALERVAELAGGRAVKLHRVDLLDREALDRVVSGGPFDAVIHFAALKAVGESVGQPLRYYRNNLEGTFNLLETMERHGLRRLVFSSSATVYGVPESVPLIESARLQATNPYGRTKLYTEEILRDLHTADPRWAITLLRYFNPVGADPSGRIGEDPAGIPNNLVPYIARVAVGRLPHLTVFGKDWPTRDGTGVRDYIHVADLAEGHVAALDPERSGAGLKVYNLGTGTGYSVLEIVAAFERASGRTVPVQYGPARPGDVAECYADASLAERELGWRARLGLDRMMEDSWRWQSQNPEGYGGPAVQGVSAR
jgi:UDP-glucose 4-epimerase